MADEKQRRYNDAQKKRILKHYERHGWKATREKYDLGTSTLTAWRRQAMNGHARPKKRGKKIDYPEARRNRALDATVLLRKAMRAVEDEVRAGAPLRESDALLRLALAELTAIKREAAE